MRIKIFQLIVRSLEHQHQIWNANSFLMKGRSKRPFPNVVVVVCLVKTVYIATNIEYMDLGGWHHLRRRVKNDYIVVFLNRWLSFCSPTRLFFPTLFGILPVNVPVLDVSWIVFLYSVFWLLKQPKNLIQPAPDIRTTMDVKANLPEKAVRRSVFLTKWHCMLNANSTKTHSSSVTF